MTASTIPHPAVSNFTSGFFINLNASSHTHKDLAINSIRIGSIHSVTKPKLCDKYARD